MGREELLRWFKPSGVCLFTLLRFLYRVTDDLLIDKSRGFFECFTHLGPFAALDTIDHPSLLIPIMSCPHLGCPAVPSLSHSPEVVHLCMYVCGMGCRFWVCACVCVWSSLFCCLTYFSGQAVCQTWDLLIFSRQSQLTTGAYFLFWRLVVGSREMGW